MSIQPSREALLPAVLLFSAHSLPSKADTRKPCRGTSLYGKLNVVTNEPMMTEGRIPVEHKPEKAPESGCCLPGNAGFGGLL